MFERLSGIRDLTLTIARDIPPLSVFTLLRDGMLWPQVNVLQLEHRYYPHDQDLEDDNVLLAGYGEIWQALLDFVRFRNAVDRVAAGRARLERLVLRPFKLSAAVREGIASLVTVDEQESAVDVRDSDSEPEWEFDDDE
ncbi:hypothetical protein AURDEDRAFT_116209 [Auricularia subglabra TFB-10046 SS5]|nr:hypothetical protein AURDEDRAFT_116209 [Auricularia subglabra TFB-10046 SS5]